MRSLVTVLAVQVDLSVPASSATGPAADTHPRCNHTSGTGSHAVLLHTAQMPGATLLAQPA